jgi:hypothetical protein
MRFNPYKAFERCLTSKKRGWGACESRAEKSGRKRTAAPPEKRGRGRNGKANKDAETIGELIKKFAE